jgi:ketosteroid isomerase-like protein
VRKLVVAFVALASMSGIALEAQVADDPRTVVEELFALMKAGDADGMAALLHEDARLITTGVRDGVPGARVVDVPRWLEGVRTSERELDERIYDVEVNVEGGLASVWTRYDLFVDGQHSHCGVDAFQLVRTEAGWRIIAIADTRTTEGCRGR